MEFIKTSKIISQQLYYIHANQTKLISSQSPLITEVSDVSNRWKKLKEQIDFFQMNFTVFNSRCDIFIKRLSTDTNTKQLEELLSEGKMVNNMIEAINLKTEKIFEIINRAEKIMMANIN